MVVSFINHYASLPANGSTYHAHVIDVTTYETSMDEHDYQQTLVPRFRLWDAVATLFHTISPDTLRDFLDPTKNEVKLDLKPKKGDTRVVIWKKGTEVLIGEFIDHPSLGVFEWDNVVRCNIDTQGAWNTTYASYGLYTTRDWPAVWRGDFTERLRGRGAIFLDAEDRFQIEFTIAKGIMDECPWASSRYDWTISRN